MKTFLFYLFLSCMATNTLLAQAPDYDVLKDAGNGSVVFKGEFGFKELMTEPTFSWMQRGSAAYKPDSTAVTYLAKHMPGYQMVVLLGTWCEDSQNLIPKLYKTLVSAEYPMSSLKMYGLDRAKEAKYVEAKLYKASKVPTIVLYKDHAEIGRIVESVSKSIEIDLAQIIRGHLEKASR
jgi:hypothetical protein